METNVTLEQVVQELNQMRRELREVKELYSHTIIENGRKDVPNAEPREVLTSAGKRDDVQLEYAVSQERAILTHNVRHLNLCTTGI